MIRNWRDATLKALKEMGEGPFHIIDIRDYILENNILGDKKIGKNPYMNVASALATLAAEEENINRVGRGLYNITLKEKKSIEKIQKEDAEESVIGVGSFGMYWERNKVNWYKSKPNLCGAQPKAESVNFYDQTGVYILYMDYKVVYVGKATVMGDRLKTHTTDRLSGRWNRFSWFGLKYVDDNGKLIDVDIKNIDLYSMIEAILIECMEPPLNRRRGDNLEPHEYFQQDSSKEDKIRENKKKVQDLIFDILKT